MQIRSVILATLLAILATVMPSFGRGRSQADADRGGQAVRTRQVTAIVADRDDLVRVISERCARSPRAGARVVEIPLVRLAGSAAANGPAGRLIAAAVSVHIDPTTGILEPIGAATQPRG